MRKKRKRTGSIDSNIDSLLSSLSPDSTTKPDKDETIKTQVQLEGEPGDGQPLQTEEVYDENPHEKERKELNNAKDALLSQLDDFDALFDM